MSEKLKLIQPAQYEGPDQTGWVKMSDIAELTEMSPDEIWDNYSEGPFPFNTWDPNTGIVFTEGKPENLGDALIPSRDGEYIRSMSSIGVRKMRPSSQPNTIEFNWAD